MNCLDVENRIQELLDHRQADLPEELSAHLAECSTCRDLWIPLKRLQQSIAAWSGSTATVNLAEVVVSRWAVEARAASDLQIVTTRPACSPLAGLLVLAASAATLLIALGIGWRVSSNATFANRQPPSAAKFASHPSESTLPSAATSDRQLDALLNDARDAYVALASQAWQDVSKANVLLPPANDAAPFGAAPPNVKVPETFSNPPIPFGQELRDAWDSWMQTVFQNQDSPT